VRAETVSRHLAEAARAIAVAILERAEAGGVRGEILEQARADLQLGDELAAVADFDQAIPAYGDVLKAADTLVFDMDLFEQDIRDRFDPKTVGYAYAVNRDGSLQRQGAGGELSQDGTFNGLARTSVDAPETQQAPDKELHIASVSKTITAVAVLKLLQDTGVGIDNTVGPYLPPEWELGDGVGAITFRELMTHRSGLANNSKPFSDFASLQAAVAVDIDSDLTQDPDLPGLKKFTYQNANYGLFRIIIPYLWDINPQTFPGQDLELVTAAINNYFVQTEIFEPMGIVADCKPNDDTQTLLYPFPSGNTNGYQSKDGCLGCGPGCWYLSVYELANFLANLRFNDDILNQDTRNLMDTLFLGWMDPANANSYAFANGAFGVYRAHSGDVSYTGGRAVHTCIMNFPTLVSGAVPIAVQASVIINSSLAGSQCGALKNAFDSAWVTN